MTVVSRENKQWKKGSNLRKARPLLPNLAAFTFALSFTAGSGSECEVC